MIKTIKRSVPLRGEVVIAADKSISHRTVIFSALASGTSRVTNFLNAADTLSSCSCIRQLGIEVEQKGAHLTIQGKGLQGLCEPKSVLDCGNSGTTMRLLTGLLAAQPFFSVLSGDQSLNQRPMKRVIEPLTRMGADIYARNDGNYPPLAVRGKKLKGFSYPLPVASAQVKSALLLAGLFAEGEMFLQEPHVSRDHTERMLAAMGADIHTKEAAITLRPGRTLSPQEFFVPGDISSAAFFMVAACIVPDSEIMIKDVGINPSRSGIIEVLTHMGAKIKLENEKVAGGEPVADLVVSSSDLSAAEISGEIIPRLIDELPVLAVAMAAARGTSVVREAGELRVKESDRISAVCSELSKMGVAIEELEDGFIIQGNPDSFHGAETDSHGDHRIAMSLAVAALRATGSTLINNSDAVDISFPTFWQELARLQK